MKHFILIEAVDDLPDNVDDMDAIAEALKQQFSAFGVSVSIDAMSEDELEARFAVEKEEDDGVSPFSMDDL